MTLRLDLDSSRATSLQLKVSPVAEAIAGEQLAGTVAAPGAGHCSGGSVVHSSIGNAGGGSGRECRPRTPPRHRCGQRHRLAAVSTSGARVVAAIAEPPSPHSCFWPRIRSVLEADLAHRMRRLAMGGLRALFSDLHPLIRWDRGSIFIEMPCDVEPANSEGSLVLMPSALCDRVRLLTSSPGQAPVLVYPARDAGSFRQVPVAHLGGLIDGPLPLLLDLNQPRTADELAGRNDMQPNRARAHLSTLQSAGLLAPCGQDPATYERTNLAGLLLNPWCARCA